MATAVIAMVAVTLSGCTVPGFEPAKADEKPSAVRTTPPAEALFPSQFTRDGTFQSHIKRGGMDYVLTLWPTKSTPRTNEWFALGDKFFSFSLTAYDLSRRLRDPYRTKRKVWLDQIRVDTKVVGQDGNEDLSAASPYTLDAEARRITLDPEPVTNRDGMLITSPKGAFELRNQRIAPVTVGSRGIILVFEATVHVQRRANRPRDLDVELLRQEVPVTIFRGTTPTVATPIPFNAN